MSKHRQHRMAAQFGLARRMRRIGTISLTIAADLSKFIDTIAEVQTSVTRFRQRATNAWEAL